MLNVSDFERSVRFYDQLLFMMSFEVEHQEREEWGAVKSYRDGEHNIWIKEDKGKEHRPFVRDVGLDHIAFRVSRRVEVQRLHDLVANLDVEITRSPKAYPEYSKNYYAFYFRDPDGIPIEIATM